MSRILIILAFVSLFLAACSKAPLPPPPPEVPTNTTASATATHPATLAYNTATTGDPQALNNQPTPTAPAQATTPAPEPNELPDAANTRWREVAAGLERPIGLANANDGSGRLFVLEQAGVIRIIRDGELLPAPFLDLRASVGSRGSEQGLLGLAFDPDYPANGFFYINYTDLEGNTVVARYHVSGDRPDQADIASESRLLYIQQPFSNHNGGHLAFGPDGYLYIGLGDGGSAGDPQGNGQSLNTLLGKMLRIDVKQGEPYAIPPDNPFARGGGKPEIWALGLRNPWRFSFDRQNGDLYLGDVGQKLWEEIDYLPAAAPPGANFGWRYFEGSHVYAGTPPSGLALTAPITEYSHDQGCSVTGGVVYRGKKMPAWQGVYLFGDYCTGNVWGLLRAPDGSWQQARLFENVGRITSFGEDDTGEVYLTDHAGKVLRLEITDRDPLAGASRYDLNITINYQDVSFSGQAQIDYTNNEDTTLDRLYFRLLPNGRGAYGNGSLTVTQAYVNQQIIQPVLSANNTVLEAPLPAPLLPAGTLHVTLGFSGRLPIDFGGKNAPSGYGIYNFTNNVMILSAWYPILAVYDQHGWNLDPVSNLGDSVYSDIAFYTVTVTSPANLVIATTGVVERLSSADGFSRYRLSSGPVRDFTMALSPDYQMRSKIVEGVKVNSYFLPQHSQGGELALDIAADSLRIYNQKFAPYPYPEFDVIETPLRDAAGVEFPNIALIGSYLYDDPRSNNFVTTVAHEVAHQWWYNVVGNNVFSEPWLDESLTTYTSSLYYEYKFGQDAATGLLNYYQNRYDQIRARGQDDQITQNMAHFENLSDPRTYGGIVYAKGALFFQALRQEVGDQAFFDALKAYYQAHQFGIAIGNDLLKSFETSSGRSLDAFYKEWLYSPGL